MTQTTTSLQRLMSNTPRSPQASSGSLMTSTTMTSPSVRRSFMRAEDELITLKKKACRPVCRRQSVMIDRLVSSAQETQRHNSENEQIRTLLERQRADSRRQKKYSEKLNETTESQKEEICRAHQGDERRRQDQQLLHEQLLKQNWDLREAHEKSLKEMEELKRFQGSTFDTIARRKLVEDRGTILELTGKTQELHNEINCMNESRDFQDAESVRSRQSHVASQPVCFPPHPVPGGMLSQFQRNAELQRGAAKHLGHTWYIGKRFCKSSRVFFSTLSAGIDSMEFGKSRTDSLIDSGERMRIGHQFKIRDASLVREILQRIMRQTNNDCRSQIFILTNSPRQQHLLVGR